MRLLTVDPMEAEIGYAVIPLVDPAQGGDMLDRIGTIRKQMAMELGLVVPPIRIRDNIQIRPTEYVIRVKGAETGRGELLPDHYLAMDTGAVQEEIVGVPTTEPAFGLKAVWITPELRDKAEAAGYTVVDAPSVLATHLSEIIKRYGAELLTRQEVQKVVDMVKESAPAVVEEMMSSLSLGEDPEGVAEPRSGIDPDPDLVSIFESRGFRKDIPSVDFQTERVRESLARIITLRVQGENGMAMVGTLSPKWEEIIRNRCTGNIMQGWQLAMDPARSPRFIASVSKAAEEMAVTGASPVLLGHPDVRLVVAPHTRNLAAEHICVSYNELSQGVQVQIHRMVE